MKVFKITIAFCLLLILAFPVCAKKNELIYSVPSKLDKTHAYILNLLEQAVKTTNEEYGVLEVVLSPYEAESITRRVRQVVSGDTDVVWAVTSTELEEKLLPVRIPLHKGVYGFRLILINKKDQHRFDKVKDLTGLKDFVIGGQALDNKILNNAGLAVGKVSTYDGTFKMLVRNRFDCLPKSIGEVFIELKQFRKQHPNLKIEDNLLLYYHQPVYFFFNDKKLAARVEVGLEKMLKDGSFNQYFDKQYKTLLDKADIANRRIIRINTPSIDIKALPLNRKELWYSVVEEAEQYGVVINLAGRQRMLTQKMSKEIVLIALGFDVESNLKLLKATSSLFDRTLNALRDGSNELRLPATKNLSIIEELDKVKVLWFPFYNETKKILSTKKVTSDQIDIIANSNIPLLQQMDKCVWLYEAESGKAGVAHDSSLASAINLSGRQRMLSQKMTKEYMLIAYDYKMSENQLLLRQTYSLFDHTLKGLINGDIMLNLKKSEKPHIRKQLLKVKALWQEFKPTLAEGADTVVVKIGHGNIQNIGKLNLELLKEVNAAVDMYENEVK